MSVLLVRDVMTIGVPVCYVGERCEAVGARLAALPGQPDAAIVLDEDGLPCGWVSQRQLGHADPAATVDAVMDDDIPGVPPDIPAEAALQIMRDRGVTHLFLMHAWPGEPRPSAVVALRDLVGEDRGDG